MDCLKVLKIGMAVLFLGGLIAGAGCASKEIVIIPEGEATWFIPYGSIVSLPAWPIPDDVSWGNRGDWKAQTRPVKYDSYVTEETTLRQGKEIETKSSLTDGEPSK